MAVIHSRTLVKRHGHYISVRSRTQYRRTGYKRIPFTITSKEEPCCPYCGALLEFEDHVRRHRKLAGGEKEFLSASFGNSATTIIRKYDAAFRVDQDLPRIADYIEYILEVSPTHRDLHLAVGLVYERIGDYILAGQHLREYLKTERGRKAESLIRKKMDKFTQDRNRADT